MLKLFRFLKPYVWGILLLVILVSILVYSNLRLPDYMARIVNTGIVGKDNHFILTTGAVMLGVAFLGAIASVGVGYLAAQIATGFARDIRERVFSKVESFSLAEFNRFSTATLITRTTNDIQQIQTVLVLVLRLVLMAPLTAVGAIYKAYHLAPSMTWIMGWAVVALLSVIITLFAIAIPRFQKLQKLVDRLNLVTREILTGLRVIRAFNRQDSEEKKFDDANVELTNANLFVNRLMVIMLPAMMLIFSLTSLAIIWVGAHGINSGTLLIGDMMAFMQYAMQVIFSFLMISIVFIMVPRASVSAQRVQELLEVEPIINDPEKPQEPDKTKAGLLEFDNATFAYPGAEAPVLYDISFVAKPGETTAFVGSTGSGKSTLINLIPRLYDVTGGAIRLDGVDVREMKQEELREKIGYVSQKPVLFSGTITSNLAYGVPDATLPEMKQAAKIAQAEEFIEDLDGKYEAPVSQGGTNLSGGQKQRLAIARALLRKPEIYIFDDSFSALDFKTDAMLRQALSSETKGKTVLIVAQRISTIMNADTIIVLNEGAVVGKGTHAELMETCSVYREIATSQLSEAELAGHTGKKRGGKEAA